MIRCNRGQSLVGFVVAMLFFTIPAMLGMNYVMKVGDAKHKTYEAARYAAWERTVWHQSDRNYNVKSNTALRGEVHARIFSDQYRPVSSRLDRNVTGRENDYRYDANLYSIERVSNRRNADRSPIIQAPQNNRAQPISIQVTESSPPTTLSGALSRSMSRLFSLEHRGLYDATVSMDIYKSDTVRDILDDVYGQNTPFTTTSNNALLVGAWNADGPGGVRRVVRRTLLTDLLNNRFINGGLSIVGSIGLSELGDLQLGHIDAERVPCQRMTNTRRRQGRGC